jgi:hypothetical protein
MHDPSKLTTHPFVKFGGGDVHVLSLDLKLSQTRGHAPGGGGLEKRLANDRGRRFYEAGGWEVALTADSDEYGAVVIYRLQLN